MKGVSHKDREIIEFQLGREAVNLGGILEYCPFGKPALLLTLPYSHGKGIFPTTYWLSCPYLVKEVSRLEDQGMIRELTGRLKEDEQFRDELKKAHINYARKRSLLLDDDDRRSLRKSSPDMLDVIENSGVGGIRDKGGIKCLHTHLADFLVNGINPVGKFVRERVDWPEECKICEIGVDRDENRGN